MNPDDEPVTLAEAPTRSLTMIEAINDALDIMLERDPDLRSPRGEALRVLLYLYGRDDAVRLLRAG